MPFRRSVTASAYHDAMSDDAIRAVLFDFGGVILTSPFEAFAHYEQRNGLPAGFIRQVNATDHRHQRVGPPRAERDRRSTSSCRSSRPRRPRLGQTVDGRRGARVPAGRGATRDGRGASTASTSRLTPGAADQQLPDRNGRVVERGLVLGRCWRCSTWSSSRPRSGCASPTRGSTRSRCERLGIEPAEAVFLDDLGINLKPARDLGHDDHQGRSTRDGGAGRAVGDSWAIALS